MHQVRQVSLSSETDNSLYHGAGYCVGVVIPRNSNHVRHWDCGRGKVPQSKVSTIVVPSRRPHHLVSSPMQEQALEEPDDGGARAARLPGAVRITRAQLQHGSDLGGNWMVTEVM